MELAKTNVCSAPTITEALNIDGDMEWAAPRIVSVDNYVNEWEEQEPALVRL